MSYDRANEAPTVSRSTSRGMRTGRRRVRRLFITVVVVVVLAVVADFAARVAAESIMATKIEQQGLPRKPDVSIEGFPFLTQVASRDFKQIKISTTDVPAGPVTLTSVNATGTGIRLNSYAFSSGTIGHLSGTVLISFASLGNTISKEVGPLGSVLNGAGLDLTAAGPDEVRASMNLVITSGSATWRVSRLSGDQLNIRLVSSSGLPPSLLSSIQDITVQIPKLPLGLTIDSVAVTPDGVVGRVSGSDVPFGS
jgi:LmeA-like phospholipid-binding